MLIWETSVYIAGSLAGECEVPKLNIARGRQLTESVIMSNPNTLAFLFQQEKRNSAEGTSEAKRLGALFRKPYTKPVHEVHLNYGTIMRKE